MVKTGCCGDLVRVLLIIINSIFFLIGLTVFIIAAVLRWGSSSILSKLSGDKEVETILNLSAIDAVSVALLALGGFVIIVSLLGLVGACCANKCFLFLYEAVIVALFIGHAIILSIGKFNILFIYF